jgi:hypothetical protein
MFVQRENLRQEAGLIKLNAEKENWAKFGLCVGETNFVSQDEK